MASREDRIKANLERFNATVEEREKEAFSHLKPIIKKIIDDVWKEKVNPIVETLQDEYAGEIRRIRAELEALREVLLADNEGTFTRSIALSKYHR